MRCPKGRVRLPSSPRRTTSQALGQLTGPHWLKGQGLHFSEKDLLDSLCSSIINLHTRRNYWFMCTYRKLVRHVKISSANSTPSENRVLQLYIGGTTLFKLFSSRNCGYSTYKLRYRSYRVLRRIEKDRRKSSYGSPPSACGFFSHEFPSYHDAKLFLTPPVDVYNVASELVSAQSDVSKFAGTPMHFRLRDMTMLRDPASHVLSGKYVAHFEC